MRCSICNHLIKIFPERGSFLNNVHEHAKCHKEKTSLKRQATVDTFFKPQKKKYRQPRSPMSATCHGLYSESISWNNKEISLTAVKSQYCSGKDISGVSKWYSIPLYTAKIETVDIKGTIRSQNCKKIVYDGLTKC